MIIKRFFFFSNFIYKGICLCKEVKKMYTGCNLKTTEFLDCALIGVCAVIRWNTVFIFVLLQDNSKY